MMQLGATHPAIHPRSCTRRSTPHDGGAVGTLVRPITLSTMEISVPSRDARLGRRRPLRAGAARRRRSRARPSSRRCAARTRSAYAGAPSSPAPSSSWRRRGSSHPGTRSPSMSSSPRAWTWSSPTMPPSWRSSPIGTPVERSTVNLFSPIVVNRHTGSADQFVPASSESRNRLERSHAAPAGAGGRRRRRRPDMLTLTREPGQKIVVGDDIVITVVSVSENGRVRLGIEAPRQIRIDREEVLERIQNENIEAGVAGSASELGGLCGAPGQPTGRRGGAGTHATPTVASQRTCTWRAARRPALTPGPRRRADLSGRKSTGQRPRRASADRVQRPSRGRGGCRNRRPAAAPR